MTARHAYAPGPDELARLLTWSPEAPAQLAPGLRDGLLAALHASAPSKPRRLDAFVVERGPHATALRTPFTWTTRAARRVLGRRVARAVATGEAPDAVTAARHEIDRHCDRARCGLERRGALGAWLAQASEPVRARCAIEAAGWAHELLSIVRPERTGLAVGTADAWYEVPGARTTLHSRRDATSATGVLRLRDGVAGPRALDGLAVDALVVALASPSVPCRVVGCWPDSGQVVALDVDADVLERAVASLLEVTDATVEGVLAAA